MDKVESIVKDTAKATAVGAGIGLAVACAPATLIYAASMAVIKAGMYLAADAYAKKKYGKHLHEA